LGAVAYTFDVDFVHRNPILSTAIMSEWKTSTEAATLGKFYSSWSAFSLDHPRAAHWIALDAFFDDEVPLPLKVRTIAATGRRCIVLGRVSPVQRSALSAEGAVAILDDDWTAAEIPGQIEAIVVGAVPVLPAQSSIGSRLTDREIQVLELFAQRRALTASSLAAALGLRTTTVRGHLFRGRRKLTAAGLKCATRGELANALQEIGYSHTDAQWHAAGRW
jgi:DNA-binding CsgD family transcriptional regulator